MSIFFYNLDFLKKHIKITDVKIKPKQPSSPQFPENQTVYKTEEKETTVSFPTKLLILCLYWT